jgi:hypothetical protein
MPGIFKFINIARNAQQGYQQPREFAREVSFGFVGGFLWVIIGIIGLAIITSLVLGFGYDIGFFKFFAFFLAIILALVISIFQGLKKFIESLSDRFVDVVVPKKRGKVITVEIDNNKKYE